MVLTQKNKFVIFNFENFILTVTILKEQPDEDEWEFTKKIMISYYDSAVIGDFKFSILFDLRKLGILPVKYYKEWADLFIEKKELTEKHIHRTCVITENIIIRNSFNFFFMIYKTSRPFKFVDSVDDGGLFLTEES